VSSGDKEGLVHIPDGMARYCIARHGCNAYNKYTKPKWSTHWTTRNPPPPGTENISLFEGHVESTRLPGLYS
jgi:hypothetical protein